MKLNLMTLSKAVWSIYQDMKLFVVIETDNAGGEGFYTKTSINIVVCSNLNVPNLANLCIKFVNITESHF